jgi:hypothetical protein
MRTGAAEEWRELDITEWIGRVVRAVKKICESKPEGRRRTGRPRWWWWWWWLEDTKYYLREMKFQRWRQKALGRVVWAFVLRWPRLSEGRT